MFSTEASTVVTEASDRRDARGSGARSRAGAAAGAKRSAFDLPPLDDEPDPTAALVN